MLARARRASARRRPSRCGARAGAARAASASRPPRRARPRRRSGSRSRSGRPSSRGRRCRRPGRCVSVNQSALLRQLAADDVQPRRVGAARDQAAGHRRRERLEDHARQEVPDHVARRRPRPAACSSGSSPRGAVTRTGRNEPSLCGTSGASAALIANERVGVRVVEDDVDPGAALRRGAGEVDRRSRRRDGHRRVQRGSARRRSRRSTSRPRRRRRAPPRSPRASRARSGR